MVAKGQRSLLYRRQGRINWGKLMGTGIGMTTKWLTLFLSQSVSRMMLDDLRAILPADAIKVFVNGLDETHYATIECVQAEQHCALIASAIVVWRQLGHVHHIIYKKGEVLREENEATQFQLFTLLKTHRAVLQIS